MKFIFPLWLIIFLCCHAMALEKKPSSKQEDFAISEPGKCGQFHGGLNDTGRLNGEDERKEYKGNHELFHSILMGKKGKGVYGGANIVHRPRPGEKNDAVLTAKASFVVSATMFSVSLALVVKFFPL
ncbi:uncharacterized protein LOC110626594 [Manihot esculenta]|uniref:Uncharacterized protein n=1 Tax=Manihot esculenta TaxID=3983 RepID=A0A2C9UZ48_MANES|nr:uncharacterized protein LOC110626594 [Manihot esculenta]OAY37011.1 hypothetical protein MANES_11G067700v8 [Manihot esculenta]